MRRQRSVLWISGLLVLASTWGAVRSSSGLPQCVDIDGDGFVRCSVFGGCIPPDGTQCGDCEEGGGFNTGGVIQQSDEDTWEQAFPDSCGGILDLDACPLRGGFAQRTFRVELDSPLETRVTCRTVRDYCFAPGSDTPLGVCFDGPAAGSPCLVREDCEAFGGANVCRLIQCPEGQCEGEAECRRADLVDTNPTLTDICFLDFECVSCITDPVVGCGADNGGILTLDPQANDVVQLVVSRFGDNVGCGFNLSVVCEFDSVSVCGNGRLEGDEQCDDGNTNNGDCCASNCSFESAGASCADGTDNQCLNPDACNGTGMCLPNDPPNGTACGDPTATECNGADACQAGLCSANLVSAGTACGDPTNDQCLNPDGCDGAGACLPNDEPDGATCDDGNAETFNDECTGGICAGVSCTEDVDCDDANECTVDACTTGACVSTPVADGASCDDPTTTDCNAADTCNAGVCNANLLAAGAACGDSTSDQCLNPDQCNGAGVCLPNDDADGTPCDDGNPLTFGDVCTNGTCAGQTGAEETDPTLAQTEACAFAFGQAEVCFEFQHGVSDSAPGGRDEITALAWCSDWDPRELGFDCNDADGNTIPETVEFFLDPSFAFFVQCDLEDPDCKLRVSIIDLSLPFALLPDGPIACVDFMVLPSEEPRPRLNLTLTSAEASDTLGMSVPMNLSSADVVIDDCCLGDCNDDGTIGIADAVSVVLELSDDDGVDVCDTLDDGAFEGVPCCDCNQDMRIDVADAVCVINGLDDLGCPTTEGAIAAAAASAQSMLPASEIRARRARVELRSPFVKGLRADAGAQPMPMIPGLRPRLTYEVAIEGETVRVPVQFKQGGDDGQVAGVDAISAFNACLDIDPRVLTLAADDLDRDEVPDSISFNLPSTHSPIVRVDLTRPQCEIQLGAIALQRPSTKLPSGLVAEITFGSIGSTPAADAIRAGEPETLSFADVLAVSHAGDLEPAAAAP